MLRLLPAAGRCRMKPPKVFDAESFLLRLRAMDLALERSGFPPISPWWWQTLERFLRRVPDGLRSLVLRVGRRGGKSSTLCRLAVAWGIWGEWSVPPGDVGVVAFISVSKDEASQRLRTIESILQALRIRFRRTGEGIELEDRRCVFKVFAARTDSVIGFTCIAEFDDEVAAWRDTDTGANPASDVLSFMAPTRATQLFAFRVVSSSPRSISDAHAKMFDQGDTDGQMVAHAPTWLANPTITEEQTRRDEPDLRVWSREYAAIPQAAALGAFDVEAVDRAFIWPKYMGAPARRIVVIDASSGKKDRWTWAVCGWNEFAHAKRLVFDSVDSVDGGFWSHTSGERIVDRIASSARLSRAGAVHGDQRESLMLRAAFRARGLSFYEHPWTNPAKQRAVELVRRWLADDRLVLPKHDNLKLELLQFEERIAPSGAFTFGARGTGHDDFVALLLTAAMAEARGLIPGGPRNAWAGMSKPEVYFSRGSLEGPSLARTAAERDQQDDYNPRRI